MQPGEIQYYNNTPFIYFNYNYEYIYIYLISKINS